MAPLRPQGTVHTLSHPCSHLTRNRTPCSSHCCLLYAFPDAFPWLTLPMESLQLTSSSLTRKALLWQGPTMFLCHSLFLCSSCLLEQPPCSSASLPPSLFTWQQQTLLCLWLRRNEPNSLEQILHSRAPVCLQDHTK